jgi:endogenous inhibitor of DNA gyrase (YacG/DUF329 family)
MSMREELPEKACAFCGKGPRVVAYAPFCSPGCQDRDLLQWMRGGYALPVSDNEDELSDIGRLDNSDLDG